MTRQAIQDALELVDREHFRKTHLAPALELGLIEMTQPDKPNSRGQRYRLSPAGRQWVTAQLVPATGAKQVTPQVAPQVTPQVGALLARLDGTMTRQAIQNALELVDREHFRKTYLTPALDLGLIEMTQPDKPNSRGQRYRLTPIGRQWLAAATKEKP